MTARASQSQSSLNLAERDELVLSQLTLVRFIARSIHQRLPGFIPFEDLVHFGVLGLLQATQNYDSTKNVPFTSFAQFRIRGAILDSLRKSDCASRRVRDTQKKLNTAFDQLSLRLGRLPTEEEVAHEVGLDVANLRRVAEVLRSVESVDRSHRFGNDCMETRDLIESAPADPGENPFVQCLRSEMRQQLTEAISNLSPRERQIVSLYYGEQRTMREIASVLGLKESRISKIHCSVIARLRAYLGAKEISNCSELGYVPVS